VSKWIVSKVTKMQYSFSGATSFNGDLSHWDVQAVIDDVQMQTTTGMYDSKLETLHVVIYCRHFSELAFFILPKNGSSVRGCHFIYRKLFLLFQFVERKSFEVSGLTKKWNY